MSRSESFEFGDFLLDVGERKLVRRNGVMNGALPEKAFQTLVHLVRRGGTLLTKEELLLAVWPDTIVEENNLGKAIHAIRRCLGERIGEQKYIETVPKYGYRFVAKVKRLSDDTDHPVPIQVAQVARVAHAAQPTTGPAPAPATGRRACGSGGSGRAAATARRACRPRRPPRAWGGCRARCRARRRSARPAGACRS